MKNLGVKLKDIISWRFLLGKYEKLEKKTTIKKLKKSTVTE